MKKQGLFFVSYLFLSVFCASVFVNAETLTSEANVSYNSDLVMAFEDNDYAQELMSQTNFIGLKIVDDEVWARISIVLKDNSGIDVVGTKEERRELVDQKIEWTNSEAEKFLNDFPGEHIKELRKNSGGFSGLISQEGLEILLESPEIDYISWSQYKPELIDKKMFSIDLTSSNFLSLILIFLLLILTLLLYKNKKRKK